MADVGAQWEERFTEDGHTYYMNTYTGESTWELPTDDAHAHVTSVSVSGASDVQIAPAWTLHTDPATQSPYYQNSLTGETAWAQQEDWVPQTDPSGKPCFYNTVTGDLLWDAGGGTDAAAASATATAAAAAAPTPAIVPPIDPTFRHSFSKPSTSPATTSTSAASNSKARPRSHAIGRPNPWTATPVATGASPAPPKRRHRRRTGRHTLPPARRPDGSKTLMPLPVERDPMSAAGTDTDGPTTLESSFTPWGISQQESLESRAESWIRQSKKRRERRARRLRGLSGSQDHLDSLEAGGSSSGSGSSDLSDPELGPDGVLLASSAASWITGAGRLVYRHTSNVAQYVVSGVGHVVKVVRPLWHRVTPMVDTFLDKASTGTASAIAVYESSGPSPVPPPLPLPLHPSATSVSAPVPPSTAAATATAAAAPPPPPLPPATSTSAAVTAASSVHLPPASVPTTPPAATSDDADAIGSVGDCSTPLVTSQPSAVSTPNAGSPGAGGVGGDDKRAEAQPDVVVAKLSV